VTDVCFVPLILVQSVFPNGSLFKLTCPTQHRYSALLTCKDEAYKLHEKPNFAPSPLLIGHPHVESCFVFSVYSNIATFLL